MLGHQWCSRETLIAQYKKKTLPLMADCNIWTSSISLQKKMKRRKSCLALTNWIMFKSLSHSAADFNIYFYCHACKTTDLVAVVVGGSSPTLVSVAFWSLMTGKQGDIHRVLVDSSVCRRGYFESQGCWIESHDGQRFFLGRQWPTKKKIRQQIIVHIF